MTHSYNFPAIEQKWQARWRAAQAFKTPSAPSKPKYYILDMFPYPSGHGLHVGHLKGYIATDVVARYKRMRGFAVLHPMGWDSFGLPTERQAEKDGITPQEVTERNIRKFREQLSLIGFSYDWERELATSDPDYYRWTQWIFILLFERDLAYRAETSVNWCPALGTVVANEEVRDGAYIETGDPIERRRMQQWLLRITSYADRLVDDLETLDWPEEVKALQRNWIGRSEGAVIRFDVASSTEAFEVFSTKPETLFGCTFCVLAPEHPLVSRITTLEQRESVDRYVRATLQKQERERLAGSATRTGEFTGAFAAHPVTGAPIPIWIAEYVLASYGTGAVFGCPAHDERDFDFANRYQLPIVKVIEWEGTTAADIGGGRMVNSDFLDGLDPLTAKRQMLEHLTRTGTGRSDTQYYLRDWLFSRQRYWGEPIPIVYTNSGHPEPDRRLPILLPAPSSLAPADTGSTAPTTPLARARSWLHTTSPDSGAPATRETNVMPQWAGSCWYYLRFTDPKNSTLPVSKELESAWMPVDLYVGGIEHATLHLLYARFWHKVLYDAGYVSTPEPFKRLFNQGKVQARSFRDSTGKYYYPSEVMEKAGQWYTQDGIGPLLTRIEKMSKSRYNVVTPEEVVAQHGADSVRLYEMFMGPLEQNNLWQTDGLTGTTRFLEKVWRLAVLSLEEPRERDEDSVVRALHRMINKVTRDVERLSLNTAVSEMMIFANEAIKQGRLSLPALSAFVRVLAPFAPHIAEELWERLGNASFVLDAPWPEYDETKAADEFVTIVLQVNGRTRTTVRMPRKSTQEEVLGVALADPTVSGLIGKRVPARIVYRSDRLLNIIVGDE